MSGLLFFWWRYGIETKCKFPKIFAKITTLKSLNLLHYFHFPLSLSSGIQKSNLKSTWTFSLGKRGKDKWQQMVFRSHRALGINMLVNMQCKVLPRVTFFIGNCKACWFSENGIGTDMFLSLLSKSFEEQKAH